MVISSTASPPKEGSAMGHIRSAPRPEDVRIGSKASRVVAMVMRHGRILLRPVSTTARLTASTVRGSLLTKVWFK